MNAWFGRKPWGAICSGLEHVDTPAGALCLFCEQVIGPDDDGMLMPVAEGVAPTHRECFIRQVIGSLGHQKGLCSCYGGNEEDPPGMTKREAAIAATDYFEEKCRNFQRALAENNGPFSNN